MNVPAVSVVIAAYNHGRFIKQTITSVLEQTFQDFEVIVLDDGSTDNTRAEVASVPDARIRYFYQPNSGLPAIGRNKGMAMAQGRYIALLDGDDYWKNDKLEKCIGVLDSMPDTGLVCHNEAVVYEGKVLRNTSYGPYEKDMYGRLLFGGNCLHTSAIVMRRQVFFDEGLRFSEDKDLFTVEDYEYWLKLSRAIKFFFIPDILGCYRVTEEGAFLASGASNTVNMLKLLDRHFAAIDLGKYGGVSAARRRKSSVMSAAGRTCLHKNDFRGGAGWYLKAIREYPLNYKAYGGLAASFLRIRVIYG